MLSIHKLVIFENQDQIQTHSTRISSQGTSGQIFIDTLFKNMYL